MGESRDPVQPEAEEEHAATGRRLGRSTAFFSIATGLSRVAGLVREIFAASYFGVGIQMSAFTIAFLVPNLVRSLFADAALQAAFVPVFTEQLERGRKVEAFRLASTLIFGALLFLGLITAIFILAAPVLMPLFAPGYSGEELDLTVALSRILFPILVMLGVSGIVVGVLNSYNRFGVFAIAPLFWNLAIIAVLVGLAPAFPDGDEIYAYAIGVVVGTILQLAMVAYDLRNTPLRLSRVFEWRSDLVKRVLLLMLPVTISLGLINFNLAINGIFGSLVPGQGEDAPAAIDKAFRIYMLPQGMFSVAVATVVFPTLARFAARRAYDDLRSTVANGMRMILLVLVPAAAAIFVLSEPMVRIVYERGDFSAGDTDLVSTALFWFAFSLPFNGLFLLLTRTFFSLQRPWIPTAISGLNLLITAGVSLALYKPYGVAGIVGATALATFASVIAQVVVLRRELGGIEFGSLLDGAVKIVAASALLAGVSYLVWNALEGALGMGTLAQIGSLSAGLAAGGLVYLGGVLAMRVPEARQLLGVLRR
ncbi:MAG: murein biosynthesis integral membrane protein MurJ [Solirubrobacterales bacterium]